MNVLRQASFIQLLPLKAQKYAALSRQVTHVANLCGCNKLECLVLKTITSYSVLCVDCKACAPLADLPANIR
jgi:hypothetical protein